MIESIFNFNEIETLINCNINDKLLDICNKFVNKIAVDINKLYFLYEGLEINKDLTCFELMNNKDKERGKMNIFVYDKKEKSKEIICPKCYENCRIKWNNYKINLFGCKNGHVINNILLEEFEETQIIDETKILCGNCNKSISKIYNKEFYKCLKCEINLCPLCKLIHDKNHKIINYEKRNYICQKHTESFLSFCEDCNINLCLLCQKEHSNHKIQKYKDISTEENEIRNILKEFRDKVNNFENSIREIINILNSVIENIEIYYKINYDILNYYECKNYQNIQNINEIINNLKLNDINKVENNIKDRFSNIFNIYNKMKDKYDRIDNKYNNIEKKDSKKFTNSKVLLTKQYEEDLFNENSNLHNSNQSSNQDKRSGTLYEIEYMDDIQILSMEKPDNIIEVVDSMIILSNEKKPLQTEYVDELFIESIIGYENSIQNCIQIEILKSAYLIIKKQYIDSIEISGISFNLRNQPSENNISISIFGKEKPENKIEYTNEMIILGEKKIIVNNIYEEEMTIRYKIDSKMNKIKIFENDFVSKNKKKCKIIYNKKYYELNELFDLKSVKEKDILEIKLIKINNITDMGSMFESCPLLSLVDFSKWSTNTVINMSYLFYDCELLSSLPDISQWNTNNVVDMTGMFYNCISLSSIPDISNWNTYNVKNIFGIFCHCKSLISLPDI